MGSSEVLRPPSAWATPVGGSLNGGQARKSVLLAGLPAAAPGVADDFFRILVDTKAQPYRLNNYQILERSADRQAWLD